VVSKEGKMLQNFEKYQQIWHNNLGTLEKGRKKQNTADVSINSNFNRKQ
jgi:hypothetical protein